jgi:hypothetical protein
LDHFSIVNNGNMVKPGKFIRYQSLTTRQWQEQIQPAVDSFVAMTGGLEPFPAAPDESKIDYFFIDKDNIAYLVQQTAYSRTYSLLSLVSAVFQVINRGFDTIST